MKLEVKYVEFEFSFVNASARVYENFVKDFCKIFQKYASNTCITKVSENINSDVLLEKITLQKSISLNTLNNVLSNYLNDNSISNKFIFENINFEYVNSRARIKVKWLK